MKQSTFTGPFPKTKIDEVRQEQIDRMNMFKQAKGTKTQWLTKNRMVRSASDTDYKRFTGTETQ